MNTWILSTRKLAAVVAAAAVPLAGCGGASRTAPPVSNSGAASPATAGATTTSAAAKPDPAVQADAAALGVYQHMVTAVAEALTTNKIGDLPKYASGSAYLTFSQAVAADINTNIVYAGTPQSAPKVSATDLTASPKIVTITDCFGGPGFLPTFAANDQAGHKKGGSAVGPGQSTAPHPLTVRVVNRTGTWLVEEYTLNAGATC